LAEGEELSSNPLCRGFKGLQSTRSAVDVDWRILAPLWRFPLAVTAGGPACGSPDESPMRTVSVEVGAKPDIITLSGHNLAQPHEHTRLGAGVTISAAPAGARQVPLAKWRSGRGRPGRVSVSTPHGLLGLARRAALPSRPSGFINRPARKRPVGLTCSRSTRCPGSGASSASWPRRAAWSLTVPTPWSGTRCTSSRRAP